MVATLITHTHPLYTNNLGFKDAQCRIFPRKADRRRALFIGDSFAEGAGLPFEQTFADRLKPAFLQTDILNAGVVSFNPQLFYYRLKYLLEVEKLHFEELFVITDISISAMRSSTPSGPLLRNP